MIELRPDLRNVFSQDSVDAFLAIEDQVVRSARSRSIGRFEVAGRGFYIKKHRPCGWWAITDDLIHGRPPHIGARPEYEAIRACERLNVATMRIAAFGQEGSGPGQKSFLITDEIVDSPSLETLCADWKTNPPPFDFKRKLIAAVARIARTLHAGGINHRDFYLCHFLLDPATSSQPRLILIDLHRAQVRRRTPRRWQVKDIAGLYYSAMDAGLTQRDLLRFIAIYGRRDRTFWNAVRRRARWTHRKEHNV
ncbi:MAG: lipopolysaccharide core heptose(I) kinase RfaP [Phycisphaeraceae bacterium]|nr:lipopolysaccharide core heptose(I) kinase RfaP [Phycisphaeraceae bacterium]